MSMVPMMAMRSASNLPVASLLVAFSTTKEGALIFTRKGWAVPSLMR